MKVLGIDIGGSGIKGAPVDTETGELLAKRYRIPTPKKAKPKGVSKVVAKIAEHFDWDGPIGCGFPAVIQNGVARTAANVSDKWIGTDAAAIFSERTGCPVFVLNDADAAGMAEMRFGVGKGREGVGFIVTVGTGLGTALFTDGELLPNTELGHLEIDGEDAEWNASDAARKREDLSWKEWAKRFDRYLRTIERLFWPDFIVIGGGASKKLHKFADRLTIKTELFPAELRNEAGIIGAALFAEKKSGLPDPSG